MSFLNAATKSYTPTKTLAKFHADESFVRVVVGPLGSGKTTAMIMELVRRAHLQRPNAWGIRRTRYAIVRNTMAQLRQTVLPEVQNWLGPAFDWREYKSTGYLNYRLGDGTMVQSEWLFIPLDTQQDTRRLLSLNITAAWISEVREVPYEIFFDIQGRIGRFRPDGEAPTWRGLICETNPWSEGSPYHENIVLEPANANWKLWRQPGGLDPEAENIENLPDGVEYYQRLMSGRTGDWIRVHVHADWGDDLSGESVFGRIFDLERHVSKSTLLVNPQRALMVTQDFGRTPAALISQIDPSGRLVTFAEVTSEGIGLEEFVRQNLLPALKDPRFVTNRVYVVADPTGAYKSQVNEQSCFDVLRSARLNVIGAPTNDIPPRLRAVENVLLRNVGKQSAALIDARHCPNLVRALAYYYRYKRHRNGTLDALPEKNHPWSDLADCYQYACCSLDGSAEQRALSWERAMNAPRKAPISAKAWT